MYQFLFSNNVEISFLVTISYTVAETVVLCVRLFIVCIIQFQHTTDSDIRRLSHALATIEPAHEVSFLGQYENSWCDTVHGNN